MAIDPNDAPRSSSRLGYVAPPEIQVQRTTAKSIGRYELLSTLGKGAMGIVYKARDPLLDRIVAVKTLAAPRGVSRRAQQAYLERFEREAKAAAKMQHPSIVSIFDVGLEGDCPYMVLEFLPGETLADRLDRVRIPLAKAVAIALDMASALAFAHAEHIVHRDMKPANVLHAGDNRWKLTDFGIARTPGSDLTQIGVFMGTPGYAPPEAIREGRYTAGADVFAWGAVFYELLTGRVPYEGHDTKTTNRYVLRGGAPPPTHFVPSLPAALEEVVLRALHPEAKTRYQEGWEAEHALRQAWQACLTGNLVPPTAFVEDEVPHERRAISEPTGDEVTVSVAAPEPPDVPAATSPELLSAPAPSSAHAPGVAAALAHAAPVTAVTAVSGPGAPGTPQAPAPAVAPAPAEYAVALAQIGALPTVDRDNPELAEAPPISSERQFLWIACALLIGLALSFSLLAWT